MLSESWSPSLFCGIPLDADAGAEDVLVLCEEAGVEDDELDPPQPATANTSASALTLASRLSGVWTPPLRDRASRVCVNFIAGSWIVRWCRLRPRRVRA